MEVATIPHVNAVINTATFFTLLAARAFISAGNEAAHKKAMISALVLSAVFLVLYLYYHANSGLARFGGQGMVRPIYFTLLIVHVIGAVAIVPLVPLAAFRALKDQREKHKRVVRYTWPLWTFVSGSGVVVYAMAIHLWPCDAACQATGIPGIIN